MLLLLALAGCEGGGAETEAGRSVSPTSDSPAVLDQAEGTGGPGELSVEQFGMALMDFDPAVRQAAIDALVGMPDPVLIPRLEHLEYALSDPDESVRETVVEALRGSEDPRVIALLLQARRDASIIVREEALDALSAIRPETGSADERFPD